MSDVETDRGETDAMGLLRQLSEQLERHDKADLESSEGRKACSDTVEHGEMDGAVIERERLDGSKRGEAVDELLGKGLSEVIEASEFNTPQSREPGG